MWLHIDEMDPADPICNIQVWLPDYEGQSFVGQEWELGAEFSFPIAANIVSCEVHPAEGGTLTPALLPDGFLVALLHLCAVASASDDCALAIDEVENALGSFGIDATASATRLAEFHRVENTYLSTFQMLGALGLLLGTAGLAAVLLRNILERRRELALLRTLGYGRAQFLAMTLAENGLLLVGGLLTGALCASLAIAPTALSQGGVFPGAALSMLLGVLLLLGLGISVIATRVALREAVLSALKSE